MLSFLTEQYELNNLGYSALNTARSALSTFIIIPGHTLGTHPLVSRFMKGVFQLRPTLPRYTAVWDIRLVLNYLRKLSPLKDLGLRDLTFKLTMLLALTSAQRIQTLHKLRFDNMTCKNGSVEFYVTDLLKQSRPGKVGLHLKFKAYAPEKRLCVYSVLKEYLTRTASIRGNEQQLLISYRKPHGKVSKDTVARWVKNTMRAAGVDVSVFKPHSTRAVSTSTAQNADVPIANILAAAGWTSEKTFQTYYNKPVNTEQNVFAESVLEA